MGLCEDLMTDLRCDVCGRPFFGYFWAKRCGEPCRREHLRRYHAARAPRNVPEPIVRSKRCPRCRERKPAEAFCRSRRQASGLDTQCKACLKRRALAGTGEETEQR
jgi:hypothetical protein